MNDFPTTFINLAGLPRFDDQRFKDEELNKWIDTLPKYRLYLKNISSKKPPFIDGIFLTREETLVFRLKFNLNESDLLD